jgi:hypothetical protein
VLLHPQHSDAHPAISILIGGIRQMSQYPARMEWATYSNTL